MAKQKQRFTDDCKFVISGYQQHRFQPKFCSPFIAPKYPEDESTPGIAPKKTCMIYLLLGR